MLRTAASDRPPRTARIAAINKIHKTEVKRTRKQKPRVYRRLRFRYKTQELIPDNYAKCVLIHACGTRGSWDHGVGQELRRQFPGAYDIYTSVCDDEGDELLGTALLIEPQPLPPGHPNLLRRRHQWVACLFVTTDGAPKADRSPNEINQIILNTRNAMRDLMYQLCDRCYEINYPWYQLRMPLINQEFGVLWGQAAGSMDGMVLRNKVRDGQEGVGTGDMYITVCSKTLGTDDTSEEEREEGDMEEE
ncbi:hypothetical protein V8F20_002850 [Naviculisporaceae sp. PSN 640]